MKLLVLSRHDEMVYAERTLHAGAHGFLTKEETQAEVLRAVRLVLTCRRYVSERIAAQVTRRLEESATHKGRTGLAGLSDREVQVFRLMGEGRTIKAIAEQLKLSPKTIETYRDNLKRKRAAVPRPGDIDAAFDPGTGGNARVFAIARQPPTASWSWAASSPASTGWTGGASCA